MQQPKTPESDRYRALQPEWAAIERFIWWYEPRRLKQQTYGTSLGTDTADEPSWQDIRPTLIDYFKLDMDKLKAEREEQERYAAWKEANPPLKWQTVATLLKRSGRKQIGSKERRKEDGFIVREDRLGAVIVQVYNKITDRYPYDHEQRDHDTKIAVEQCTEVLTAAGLVVAHDKLFKSRLYVSKPIVEPE